jgi:hypothetical protein
MSLLAPAHKKASAFTSTFQTPFGDFMSQLIAPIWKANADKSLTYDQAKSALDSFNQQWTAFDLGAQQFKSMGGDYAKVVGQAYDPQGDFMKTVNMVRQSLTDINTALKPADTTDPNKDATTPPDPNNPPGTGGQSATATARTAAANQKRRNAGGVGFLSTILGGSMNTTTTQRKTLLGY